MHLLKKNKNKTLFNFLIHGTPELHCSSHTRSLWAEVQTDTMEECVSESNPCYQSGYARLPISDVPLSTRRDVDH